jgi:hypothetical protein
LVEVLRDLFAHVLHRVEVVPDVLVGLAVVMVVALVAVLVRVVVRGFILVVVGVLAARGFLEVGVVEVDRGDERWDRCRGSPGSGRRTRRSRRRW